MRKQNKLVTVNKHNKKMFAQGVDREHNNIFDGAEGSIITTPYFDPYYGYWKSAAVPLDNRQVPSVGAINGISSPINSPTWGSMSVPQFNNAYTNPPTLYPYSLRSNKLVAPSLNRNAISVVPSSIITNLDSKVQSSTNPLLGYKKGDLGVTVSDLEDAIAKSSIETPKKGFWSGSGAGPQIVGAVGNMIGSAVGNKARDGYTGGGGAAIGTIGSTVGGLLMTNPATAWLGAGLMTASPIIGAFSDRTLGTKRNEDNINAALSTAGTAKAVGDRASKAQTSSGLMDAARNMTSNLGLQGKDYIKKGWARRLLGHENRAGNKYRDRVDTAIAMQNHGIELGEGNIARNLKENALVNFGALGGLLNMGNIDPATAIGYDLLHQNALSRDTQANAKGNAFTNLFAGAPNVVAKGGRIEIKHPGRLTALKKRTGKTEAELYNDGNPEHKKMVVFARNARKWKKAYGGFLDAADNLFALGGDTGPKEETSVRKKLASGWYDNVVQPFVSLYDAITGNGAGGTYGGAEGSFEGAGSGGDFYLSTSVPPRENEFRGLAWPTEKTFNEAYAEARRKGQKTFYFNGKKYSTDYDTSNDSKRAKAHKKAGDARKEYGFNGAGKWKYADGGTLMAFGGNLEKNGADYPTGLVHIDEGGSHEENPYQGVQMGVDPQGTPNLVEEGETIWNDYVFSNRIFADGGTLKKFHLNEKREITYANLAKKLEKEISERVNDPISQAAFDKQMAMLAEEQERQKQEEQAREAQEAFAQLPPEEQVALMQQEQQAQEQGMEEQAKQEQMMQQQPSEEEMIAQQMAAQQQMPPQGIMPQGITSDMIAQQGMPMMGAYGGLLNQYGYGGNLFALGGPDGGGRGGGIRNSAGLSPQEVAQITSLIEDYGNKKGESLIRRRLGDNEFTRAAEKLAVILEDPINYFASDYINIIVDKLATLSEPALNKFFQTNIGSKIASAITYYNDASEKMNGNVHKSASPWMNKPGMRMAANVSKQAFSKVSKVAKRWTNNASNSSKQAGYGTSAKSPAPNNAPITEGRAGTSIGQGFRVEPTNTNSLAVGRTSVGTNRTSTMNRGAQKVQTQRTPQPWTRTSEQAAFEKSYAAAETPGRELPMTFSWSPTARWGAGLLGTGAGVGLLATAYNNAEDTGVNAAVAQGARYVGSQGYQYITGKKKYTVEDYYNRTNAPYDNEQDKQERIYLVKQAIKQMGYDSNKPVEASIIGNVIHNLFFEGKTNIDKYLEARKTNSVGRISLDSKSNGQKLQQSSRGNSSTNTSKAQNSGMDRPKDVLGNEWLTEKGAKDANNRIFKKHPDILAAWEVLGEKGISPQERFSIIRAYYDEKGNEREVPLLPANSNDMSNTLIQDYSQAGYPTNFGGYNNSYVSPNPSQPSAPATLAPASVPQGQGVSLESAVAQAAAQDNPAQAPVSTTATTPTVPVNLWDNDDLSLGQRILTSLDKRTWNDFMDWAKENKLDDDLFKKGIDKTNWNTVLANQAFRDALGKLDDTTLADAIVRGYDYGNYKYVPKPEDIQSINDGNWDTSKTAKDIIASWNAGNDELWSEIRDKVNDQMSREELEQLMMGTKAWQNTTKYLKESPDHMLNYLQAIASTEGAPKSALTHLEKFTETDNDGKLKWKDKYAKMKPDELYQEVFGKVRHTYPGSYWHSFTPATQGEDTLNFIQDKNGNWAPLETGTDGLTLKRQYKYANDKGNHTLNYYVSGNNNAVEKDAANKAIEELAEGKYDIRPRHKDSWMRYAPLFGAPINLGLMAAGVGKPKLDRYDAALAGYEPVTATYEPVGGYMAYSPMDIWAAQNSANAQARAISREIVNNASPIGQRMAGDIALAYNNDVNEGKRHREAMEYDDKLRQATTAHNLGVDVQNAQAFNALSQYNASALNNYRQNLAGLRLNIADKKNEAEADWYNQLYGNIGQGLTALGKIGNDNEQFNMMAELAALGVFGPMNPRSAWGSRFFEIVPRDETTGQAAKGGKIRRRKGGLTY